MRYTRPCILILVSVLGIAAGPTTAPSTRPGADGLTRAHEFTDGFRCSHYLHLAVQLQQLDRDRRILRLREMAADGNAGSELFPIYRMLFDRKPGGEFRRPLLGGEGFVGSLDPFRRSDYDRWPLDPITLQDGVPILVGRGFILGGRAETPAEYLDYCRAQCKWRDAKFTDADPARIRNAVEAFIAATTGLSADDVTFLRQQAA